MAPDQRSETQHDIDEAKKRKEKKVNIRKFNLIADDFLVFLILFSARTLSSYLIVEKKKSR